MSWRDNSDLLGKIQEIIRHETFHLRHHYAKVENNFDPLKKGRVQVSIPQLRQVPPNFLWCHPRQNNSLTVPNIGDYVDVYFMFNNIGSQMEYVPVYLYPATEMEGMANKAAAPSPFLDVIYSNPESGSEAITYERKSGLMKILSWFTLSKATPKIMILDGTEPFVLGTQLQTYLNNFITNVFNTHTHLYLPGPGASTPTAVPSPAGTAPSGITSTEIMGK